MPTWTTAVGRDSAKARAVAAAASTGPIPQTRVAPPLAPASSRSVAATTRITARTVTASLGVTREARSAPADDFPRRILGRVVLRQNVVRPVAPLPLRHGRLALRLRDEAGAVDELVLVDVARAVREHLGRVDPHDELRLRILRKQGILLVHRRETVQPQPLPALEVDDEQAHVPGREQSAGSQEHAVPVVDGKREGVLVDDADEAGLAPLVGALRLSVLVGRGDEEHVPGLDEGAVVGVDHLTDDALLDPVREASRVEAVLEPAAGFVVEAHPPDFSGKPQAEQTFEAHDLGIQTLTVRSEERRGG